MRTPLGLVTAISTALLILPVSIGHAQDDDRPNSLEQGSWALLFQVNGLPSVDFFEGMIAAKYHVTNRQAWRFGIGGNGGTSGGGAHVQGGASVLAQYVLYPRTDREVNLYLGAGPRVGLSYMRSERPALDDDRRTRWDLGLTGRLGVEWFATRSISLLGEYGNEIAIRFENRSVNNEEDDFSDYLYRTSVKLGIAAYF